MFEVRFVPRNEFDRNIGVRLMEENRNGLNIDGKIFSHTFAMPCKEGRGLERQGSASCFVPDKDDAHFLAFEIETKVGCVTTVEAW
jgi:hypothetical protein